MSNNTSGVRRLSLLAMFVAIIIVMAFTPLGYLKAGPVAITFLPIPIVIGAITLGPAAGAFLGFVFGVTSFIQCFGSDWFGTTLFGINPVLTCLLCLLPRILMGWLSGIIFRGLSKTKLRSLWAYGISSLSGALLNTIGFTGCLLLFFTTDTFGNSASFFDAMMLGGVVSTASAAAVIGALITLNAVIEALVCLALGLVISKAIDAVFFKKKV